MEEPPYFFPIEVDYFLTQDFKFVELGYGLFNGMFTYDSSQMCYKAAYIDRHGAVHSYASNEECIQYYFAAENATIPTGARRLTVYVKSYEGGSDMALRPCNSSRQYFSNNYTVIPSGTQQNQWFDIYGTVDVSQVPNLNLNDYRVHFFAGKASPSDGNPH